MATKAKEVPAAVIASMAKMLGQQWNPPDDLPRPIRDAMIRIGSRKLAFDDDLFNLAARERGVDISGNRLPPPPRQQ